jgi:hypothetical protein
MEWVTWGMGEATERGWVGEQKWRERGTDGGIEGERNGGRDLESIGGWVGTGWGGERRGWACGGKTRKLLLAS